MYNNTPGYISSLNINVLDDTTYEMDDGIKLPKHLECAVGFTYIGKYLQSTTGKHFDLGWLKNPTGDGATEISEVPFPLKPVDLEGDIFIKTGYDSSTTPNPSDVDLDILDDVPLDPIGG